MTDDKAINQENFIQLRQLKPKRIYLPTANVLKTRMHDTYLGTLNFSFAETIQKIFEKETGLNLFPNKNDRHNENSVWCYISTKSELTTIWEWIEQQGRTVFIRSLLPLCIALDVNIDFNNEVKTDIGELEYQAKSNKCQQSIKTLAIKTLVDICCDCIQRMSFYKDASYISAVPANEDKEFDLPATLVAEIANRLGITNLTNGFQYGKTKPMLKNESIGDKWQKLEESQLVFGANRAENGTIILLDDKYQSGATMHYVASKLQQTGFDEIYGLALVKTIKDDDNQ